MFTNHLWLILLSLFVSASIAQSSERQNRPITPEEIVDLRWIGVQNFSLSPDGKLVAYTVIEWDKSGKKAKRKRTLWIVPTDGSRQPRQIAKKLERVKNRQWSPNGKHLAFLSEVKAGKKKKSQIFLIRADGSGLRQLTDEPEGVTDYAWAPDSSKIAFSTLGPEHKRPKDAPIEVDKHLNNGRLRLVRVATKKVTVITNGKHHIYDFAWAPDGKQLAVVQAPSPDLDDTFNKSALIILDRSGSTVRALSNQVIKGFKLSWSPDGKYIVYSRHRNNKITRHTAVIPARGGEPAYPMEGLRASPFWTVVWDADSENLWVQIFESTRNRLIKVNIKTRRIRRLANDVQNFWSFGLSRDSRTFIVNEEDGKKPPELAVFKDSRKIRHLTNINPHVAKWNLGDVKEVLWKSSRDGMLINGVLVTPPGLRPGQPVPLIVELHGGPQGMWWNGWLGTYVSRGQYFASRGYSTFLPNPRGSFGWGTKYLEANYQDWGGMDVQDILDGIDHLVEKKIADPKRLAVGGLSYGGFLTAMITSKSNRFRAAVVDAGVTDLYKFGVTGDISSPIRAYMGGDEWSKFEFYRRCSPLTYVHRCKTPTLVLHGEKDARVVLMQGRAWYKALNYLGVKTEMVIYPGAGHVLTERSHMLDSMRRVTAWYETHLK